MRVTLTHLRRLLEPDRSGGDASYHLRTDGDTIRLLKSEFLSVDLWTLDILDKRAVQARADGDIDRTAALLADAVALWRGDPLPDLHHLRSPGPRGRGRPGPHPPCRPPAGAGRTAPGRRRRGGVLRAGRAALSLEPFDARGHRVALAAALRGRRPAQIAAAHRRVCSALRQLGVPPDPPTAILLRQAARWAGTGTADRQPTSPGSLRDDG